MKVFTSEITVTEIQTPMTVDTTRWVAGGGETKYSKYACVVRIIQLTGVTKHRKTYTHTFLVKSTVYSPVILWWKV